MVCRRNIITRHCFWNKENRSTKFDRGVTVVQLLLDEKVLKYYYERCGSVSVGNATVI